MPVAQAVNQAQLISILLPDTSQAAIFERDIRPNLDGNDMVMFAHGFAIHFDQITPPDFVDVALVAPKGPGALVRRTYEEGAGVPALRAVHQDYSGSADARSLAYANGLGAPRKNIIMTSFKEECETDLFGEQAVLCGGLSELIRLGYETLVEAGYQPEVAYFECLHEVKLIVDLFHEGGYRKMLQFISDTAKWGDFVSGPRVVNEETRERMREVLKDIQSGSFAHDWVLENQTGMTRFKSAWRQELDHPIEDVGKKLRAKMPWLDAGDDSVKNADPSRAGS